MTGPGEGRAGRVGSCAGTALLAAALLAAGDPARAPAAEKPDLGEAAQAAAEGGGRASCTARWLAWATAREPGNSPLARFESLTGSSREGRTELRGECAAVLGAIQADARPRLALEERRWSDRPEERDTERDVSIYLNEGAIAWEPDPSVRLSLERFVADWGPAVTVSPSNPLGRRDARLHPKEELGGSDFAAVRWFAADAWTAALLANLDEGRADPPRFRRSAVLKIDRAQGDSYQSLVLSQAEGGEARAGAYAIGSLGEALRVYAEAGAARRDAEAVAGLSYPFGSGGMLTAEYFHNESGSIGREAAAIAAAAAAGDSRDRFLRKNYLTLQCSGTDARGGRDGLLRLVLGLDDGSSALVGLAEQGIGGHARVFVFAIRTFGGPGDEFPAVLRSTISAGFEYSF